MTLFRVRRYGSDEWTLASLDGPLEEVLLQILETGLDLRNSLATADQLHVQAAREGEPWADLDEFEWEE